MMQYETTNYIFHYNEGSKAETDIAQIAACQEGCFAYICQVLNITPAFKIHYFLCDTPEEVGHIYGDDDPCNGFAVPPDTVYAVYNESVKCIGFHEDAHLISYLIRRPNYPAIREGLAMYFDRKWWGIHNPDWAAYYLKTGSFVPVDSLLDKETFCDTDCAISYPIMGAFTDYLINTYGKEKYLSMYRRDNTPAALEETYGKSPAALNADFTAYLRLFRTDEAIEERMKLLLADYFSI